jgi:YVTN family beta-propeller protein
MPPCPQPGSSRAPRARCAAMLVVLALSTASAQAATRFAGPTSSQPLALSADGTLLASVNPDKATVSFFDVASDDEHRLARVTTMLEPWGVAIAPDGVKTWVANTASGTVTVIRRNAPATFAVEKQITVGTEPYGMALTPNGTRLYVSNARSNTVSVIDTSSDLVVKTIAVGPEPRGIAISNDGDADDLDETVYVTHFLALLAAGKTEGQDDAKTGRVSVIPTASNTVSTVGVLQPLANTRFKANGDALARVAPGASFTFPTGAYPNQLNGIALRRGFAFVPSTGVSPNGPVRFDVSVQSLVSVLDRADNSDAGVTRNLQQAVALQENPERRFVAVPWAIAFEHAADVGWIASAASDVLVKITIDPATGEPSVRRDPSDRTRVLEVPTGKNPRGIVIDATDTRAYVMNYVSRDVTVIDLTTSPEQVRTTLHSERVPLQKNREAKILLGAELYNTSIGTFDPPAAGQPPITGRMSRDGWMSCAACHPFGLSDGATWIFASGPRRTIAQHADFDHSAGALRALGWSAIFDEEQDLERYVRDVAGGAGLIVSSDGVTPNPSLAAFDPPSTPLRQLKVRGIRALDALAIYVRAGIRAPISPVAKSDPDVVSGRALFAAANCQQCHGGLTWSSARVRYTPPPGAGVIVNGQILGELRNVGTFSNVAFNEVRADASAPLGAAGYAPPSLLSVAALPGGFLHNGAAATLDEVLQNVTHRSAGTGGVDTLSNASDRAKIVAFLRSIDATSQPFP